MSEYGLRIDYDAKRKLITLMYGLHCVEQMTFQTYIETFGVHAAAELVVWQARSYLR